MIGLFFRRRAEDVDHLPDLAVAAEDRIDLAGARRLREVVRELRQRAFAGRRATGASRAAFTRVVPVRLRFDARPRSCPRSGRALA